VIGSLEDAEDYRAFEASVTADCRKRRGARAAAREPLEVTTSHAIETVLFVMDTNELSKDRCVIPESSGNNKLIRFSPSASAPLSDFEAGYARFGNSREWIRFINA
jgi:hypothetical protein